MSHNSGEPPPLIQNKISTTESKTPTSTYQQVTKVFPPRKTNVAKNITASRCRYSPYPNFTGDPVMPQSLSTNHLLNLNPKETFLQNADDDNLRKSFSVPCELNQKYISGGTDSKTMRVTLNNMNSLAILRLAKIAELARRSGLVNDNQDAAENEKSILKLGTRNAVKNELLKQIDFKSLIRNIKGNAGLAHSTFPAKLLMSQIHSSSSRTLKISSELTKRQCSVRHTIIPSLKTHGFCVLDNFLGSNNAMQIKNTMENLYESGLCKNGKLIGKSPNSNSVRGDKIAWLTGDEAGSESIAGLMKFVDTIVGSGCGLLPNDYNINGGTKAMVACYPGKGERYKLHVDNPMKDGRCLTCIYYTNDKWDSPSMGGKLRMHAQTSGRTAEIAPKFDRVVFFYSDKRNPHEVLPAYSKRMAVTLWYFDYEERQRALANRPISFQQMKKKS